MLNGTRPNLIIANDIQPVRQKYDYSSDTAGLQKKLFLLEDTLSKKDWLAATVVAADIHSRIGRIMQLACEENQKTQLLKQIGEKLA